jgi:ACS family hexuronate transporter-like MFS transporter
MISPDKVSYRWVILSVIFGSQFVLSMAAFGWGPLAPFFKEVMSLSSTEIGIISSTFYLAAAVSVFPAGVMVDRYGVKKGLLSWLGLTGFPLFLLSLIHHNYSFFLIMVAIAGAGYSISNPVATKGLYIWFDRRIRGTAFGIRQSAVTVGGAVAGIFLVYMSQRSGPFAAVRTVCWMIMGMMVLAFTMYRAPERTEITPPSRGTKNGWAISSGFRGFFSRPFLTLSMVVAMLGLAQGVVVTFFLLYINERLGYSLLAAGSFFTVFMVSGAVGRILWGIMSDLIFHGNRKPVLIIISLTAIVSVAMLAYWSRTWPHWLFISVIIGIGISSWGWNAITFLFVAEISDRTKTATSVGLATAFGWLGMSLGPLVFGSLTDCFGYFYAWMSLAVFCTFSLLLCLLLPGSITRTS